MSDISFLSDSSDEATVEDLLNQAIDDSVLKQIAKINCASFSNDSVLPTNLENRFSRLKSFPVTNPKPVPAEKNNSQSGPKIEKMSKSVSPSDDEFGKDELGLDLGPGSAYNCSKSSKFNKKTKSLEKKMGIRKELGSGSSNSPAKDFNSQLGPKIEKGSESFSFSDDEFEEKQVGGNELELDLGSGSGYYCSKSSKSKKKTKAFEKKRGIRKELGSGSSDSPSNLSDSSTGEEMFSTLGVNSRERKGVKSKSGNGSFLFRSDSSDNSLSPPKKLGCLWGSLKTSFGKGSKGRRGKGNSDEYLSDLSVFSSKKQRKLIEKMMREEEKISQEAEKIVKLAKQGSIKMNI